MPHNYYMLEREGPSATPYGPKTEKEIIYPESDGKPMADNTKQFRWIVKIKEGLEAMFAGRPDVFVAGDLLWYPVEGNNKIRVAPDAMTVFGRPKGDRGSYRQWEEDGIAPQVVFEVLSPGNMKKEMTKKREFYRKYGVEEYYLYDPDEVTLDGWIRSENKLVKISNVRGWISPLLEIRFELTDERLVIYRPDNRPFLSFLENEVRADEEKRLKEAARDQAVKAEAEKKVSDARAAKAELEKEKSDARAAKAEAEKEKSDARAEKAEAKAEMLMMKLRELGISV